MNGFSFALNTLYMMYIPGRHVYVTSRYVMSSLKHGRLLSNSVFGTDISQECLPEHSLKEELKSVWLEYRDRINAPKYA